MQFDSVLPPQWSWSTIDDLKASGRSLVSGPFGSNIGSRFFVSSGIPVIRGNNLQLGAVRFIDSGFVFLTQEKASEFPNCVAIAGDLVLTAAGTIGQVGIIPKRSDYPQYIISNKQLRARLNRDRVLPLFAYYWLSSREMVTYIQTRNTGSTVPLINLSVLKSMPVPLPPVSIQQGIVDVLDALDERIDNLSRTSKTLEGVARTIFRSWFVDFDPVRAKIEGREPDGTDSATAALFPDKFSESAEQVPPGWHMGTLSEVATLNPESWTRSSYPGAITYVDLANTKWGRIEATTEHTRETAPSRAQRVLRSGDTIVGTVRPGNGSYAFVQQEGLTGSTGFAVLRPRESIWTAFLYLAATSKVNVEHLAHLADGAAYPAVRPEVVADSPVMIPTPEVAEAFCILTLPILQKIAANEALEGTLSELRNILLPRLIIGKLRIPEAEKLVASAL